VIGVAIDLAAAEGAIEFDFLKEADDAAAVVRSARGLLPTRKH
jgi:hypothetical protein